MNVFLQNKKKKKKLYHKTTMCERIYILNFHWKRDINICQNIFTFLMYRSLFQLWYYSIEMQDCWKYKNIIFNFNPSYNVLLRFDAVPENCLAKTRQITLTFRKLCVSLLILYAFSFLLLSILWHRNYFVQLEGILESIYCIATIQRKETS